MNWKTWAELVPEPVLRDRFGTGQVQDAKSSERYSFSQLFTGTSYLKEKR